MLFYHLMADEGVLPDMKSKGQAQSKHGRRISSFRLSSEPIVPSVTTRHFLMNGKFRNMSGTLKSRTNAG